MSCGMSCGMSAEEQQKCSMQDRFMLLMVVARCQSAHSRMLTFVRCQALSARPVCEMPMVVVLALWWLT
jgi:hypothetical protein